MSKAKGAVKLMSRFRITVPAAKAAPAPPLGPQLGQKGVNLGKFCKEFNERTAHIIDGAPLPTDVEVFSDRSYNMKIRTPTTTWFLFRAAGITKGADQCTREVVGRVNLKQVYEIAKVKQTTNIQMEMMPLQEVCDLIIRGAWGMGIEVYDETKEEMERGGA